MQTQRSVPRAQFPAPHVGHLVLAVMLAACGPTGADRPEETTGVGGDTTDAVCSSDSSTTQEVDEDAAECKDGAPANACCCFSPQQSPSFGFPTPCAKKIACSELIFDECKVERNVLCGSTVDCHLNTLLRGEYGVLRWRKTCGDSISTYHTEIYIVGDGTVFERWWHDHYSNVATAAVRRALRPPEYFTECLAMEEVSARHACMLGGILYAPLEVCYNSGEEFFPTDG